MTEQIAIQEENEKLKAEKNSLIARIADLTLEKADMRAKLQGLEELEAQCSTCECAKFADEAIKPSMALNMYNALKNSVKKD